MVVVGKKDVEEEVTARVGFYNQAHVAGGHRPSVAQAPNCLFGRGRPTHPHETIRRDVLRI